MWLVRHGAAVGGPGDYVCAARTKRSKVCSVGIDARAWSAVDHPEQRPSSPRAVVAARIKHPVEPEGMGARPRPGSGRSEAVQTCEAVPTAGRLVMAPTEI